MLHRWLVIIVLVGLLLPGMGYAAPTVHFGAKPAWVIPVKNNDQQPNLRDVNDGYYLKLYEQEINVARDEVYQHTIKDIVSDAGVQGASNININFNPAYEQLTVHQVTVWRDGQPLDKLQKDAFKVIANEDELQMFVYNGNYSAYLILKDIRKGDKIEYSYTVSGSNPIFNKKFFTYFTFQGSDPISQVHYCVLAPANRPFAAKYFNDAAKPVITTTSAGVLYDWDLLNVKGAESANNAPGWFNPSPRVQLSEYKDWSEVTDWAYKINTPEDKLKGALGKRVADLQKQYGTDSVALFRALVTVVQNEVRYMGVELGPYSHRANTPEKVYEQRYGDCKDKSMLLVSMLRSVGMRAEMALVNSWNKSKISEDLPSPSSFNHAIVLAHFAGSDVWIDPTISYQGGKGTEYYFPDYGNALVLAPGNNALTPIPETPSGTIDYTEEYEMSDIKKPVTLTVKTTYSLNTADDIRATFANQSKSDLEKNYLDYYSKIYPHIEALDTVEITDDKVANTVVTVERYTLDDLYEYDSVNQNYAASFYAAMIKNQLPVPGNKKIFPIAVSHPYKIHYSINLLGPLNWGTEHKSEHISRNAYYFSYNIMSTSQRLGIEYTFTYLKDHIEPNEIAQYEKDRKKITDEYLSYSFTYTPAGTGKHKDPNYLAILIALVLIGGCVHAGILIYKTKTVRSPYANHEPMELGGWLILPILGLLYTVGAVSYMLLTNGYLSSASWHAYDGRSNSLGFELILAMELIVNVVLLCFSAFCLVLIYYKRDILPKYIKILYISWLVFGIIDNVAAHALSSAYDIDYKDIFRRIYPVIIWVPYFSIAQRVKNTFIVAYPDLGYELPAPAPAMSEPVEENGNEEPRNEDV